jgi:hypothetical protein
MLSDIHFSVCLSYYWLLIQKKMIEDGVEAVLTIFEAKLAKTRDTPRSIYEVDVFLSYSFYLEIFLFIILTDSR